MNFTAFRCEPHSCNQTGAAVQFEVDVKNPNQEYVGIETLSEALRVAESLLDCSVDTAPLSSIADVRGRQIQVASSLVGEDKARLIVRTNEPGFEFSAVIGRRGVFKSKQIERAA